jgi:hypothetical protein
MLTEASGLAKLRRYLQAKGSLADAALRDIRD